ncbi:hypothetical protein D3C77_457950 [compost metagenome]
MQAQTAQVQLAEMAVAAHLQAQAKQRAIACHRVIQRRQVQRQDVGRVTGAKTTAHAIDGLALHRCIPRHTQGRSGLLERVELENAERWQRSHVVRPQQMHQRVAQLRQLVIELLSQSPGEKGEPFEQALHIRVPPSLAKKWRQRRTTLGETAT